LFSFHVQQSLAIGIQASSLWLHTTTSSLLFPLEWPALDTPASASLASSRRAIGIQAKLTTKWLLETSASKGGGITGNYIRNIYFLENAYYYATFPVRGKGRDRSLVAYKSYFHYILQIPMKSCIWEENASMRQIMDSNHREKKRKKRKESFDSFY
jgi:hypothetical protein